MCVIQGYILEKQKKIKMNKKTKLINELKEFSTTIENCCGDCDNCSMYEICIEKYSNGNIIDLLNETIEYIKEE